jgi:hypothetical protein
VRPVATAVNPIAKNWIRCCISSSDVRKRIKTKIITMAGAIGIAIKRAAAMSELIGHSRFVQASMEIAYARAINSNSLIKRFDA